MIGTSYMQSAKCQTRRHTHVQKQKHYDNTIHKKYERDLKLQIFANDLQFPSNTREDFPLGQFKEMEKKFK